MRAADLNSDGLFLRTEMPVDLHYVMDLVIRLPAGPIEVFGVARFVGMTRYGHGVGVALHSMTKEESERWWTFYRAQVAATSKPLFELGFVGAR
jgi:alkylated DNA nucleotide flippase Atl1